MTDNLISNSKPLHCLQNRKYIKQGKGKPIGLIKFIESDYIDELYNNETFYFNNILSFEPKNEEEKSDIRKDDKEGKYNLKGNPIPITINDLEDLFIQTYSTSFTLLFKDDFDEDEKLKISTVKKLQKSEKNKKSRPFVIVNFHHFQLRIEQLSRNTPRLINKYLPSPKTKKGIAEIYSGIHEVNNLYSQIENSDSVDKSLKKEARKQLTECRNLDKDIIQALQNTGIINSEDKEKNLEEFTFHGGFVYYEDSDEYFDPFTDDVEELITDNGALNVQKIKGLSKETQYKFYKKLIECLISLKEHKYSNEVEYRLLISNFDYNNKLKGIKLLHDGNKIFNFKQYNFCELESLKREDFSEFNM